jgi:hypothetical protein
VLVWRLTMPSYPARVKFHIQLDCIIGSEAHIQTQ